MRKCGQGTKRGMDRTGWSFSLIREYVRSCSPNFQLASSATQLSMPTHKNPQMDNEHENGGGLLELQQVQPSDNAKHLETEIRQEEVIETQGVDEKEEEL